MKIVDIFSPITLDVDIKEFLVLKLYALIKEQKDYIDEYGIMRILVDDEELIDYLYLHNKKSSAINIIDKQYFIVKLEIRNTGDHFVYLKELGSLDDQIYIEDKMRGDSRKKKLVVEWPKSEYDTATEFAQELGITIQTASKFINHPECRPGYIKNIMVYKNGEQIG